MSITQESIQEACNYYKDAMLMEYLLFAPVDTGALRSGMNIVIEVEIHNRVSVYVYSDVDYFVYAFGRQMERYNPNIVEQVLNEYAPKIASLAEKIRGIKIRRVIKIRGIVNSLRG